MAHNRLHNVCTSHAPLIAKTINAVSACIIWSNLSCMSRAQAIRFASTTTSSSLWKRAVRSPYSLHLPTKASVIGTTATSCLVVSRATLPVREYSTSRNASSDPVNSTVSSNRTDAKPSGALLTFKSGVSILPHPDKVAKGGEDACFVSSDGKVLAVADGVGGWADVGVDPAFYSKGLMKGAKALTDKPNYSKNPVDVMQAGFLSTAGIKGSSTCCVVVLDNGVLRSANLGDSGYMVVRDKKTLFRSKEQQYSFNFPYQLGEQGETQPSSAEQHKLELSEGDLVILGTDGLFDNLFENQILEIVNENTSVTDMATKLAKRAQEVGHTTAGPSPFQQGAKKYGYSYAGGKLDDITVIVAKVAR